MGSNEGKNGDEACIFLIAVFTRDLLTHSVTVHCTHLKSRYSVDEENFVLSRTSVL